MTRSLTIDYGDDVLLALGLTPEEFREEAKLLIAVKLYEMGRLSTGAAGCIGGPAQAVVLDEAGGLRCRHLRLVRGRASTRLERCATSSVTPRPCSIYSVRPALDRLQRLRFRLKAATYRLVLDLAGEVG